jgi:hypothetical protein
MPRPANDPRARRLLAVDSAANYLLGLPLLVAPEPTARLLGLPATGNGFYPRVLGGVLTGIATALAVERQRRQSDLVGLGTGGAIAVNTLGGGAVALWLATADADRLPRRGRVLLGGVVATVLAIGGLEAWAAVTVGGGLRSFRRGVGRGLIANEGRDVAAGDRHVHDVQPPAG